MENIRTLILCVDRDDDIGFKAGVTSPPVGREECLNTAEKLAIADPEDSDVNAIFQGIKTYDELKDKGEDVYIAVIGGSHTNMLEGDRRISHDLGKIVWDFEINECILVTDGAEDEFILPVIQSTVDVKSVQRVIVKQMPNLEGTYYIVKKLFDDPEIAKTILVPVGLAMLLYAVSILLGYPGIAVVIVVGVLGLYLLFKGYGIDDYFEITLKSLQSSFFGGKFTFVTYIAAIFIGIMGIIIGLTTLLEWYSSDQGILLYALLFVYGAIWYFTASALIASIGKIIDIFLNEIKSLGRFIAIPFFVLAIGIIAYGACVYTIAISTDIEFPILGGNSIKLIVYTTLGGLICAGFGIYLQKYVTKWTKKLSLANKTTDKTSDKNKAF